MPLLWSVVLGVALGMLRFGSPGYLPHLPMRLGWLFPMALLIQFVSVRFVPSGEGADLDARGALFLLGYGVVLAGVLANRHGLAYRILGLGFALNLLAVLPHGGYMPITVAAY